MIFIKSFYRKKTIKNYFIITTLTFFAIFSLLFIRQYYINKNNDYYKSSFIFLEAKNIEMSSIENKNKNIKDYFYALKDEHGEIFVIDNDLNNNEIILPSFLKKEYKENDKLFIEEYNLELRIKEFQDENNFYYISEKNFEQLKNSDVDLIYIISLKNYIYKEKTINDLQNTFEENIIYFYDTSITNYKNIIIVITTFLKIIVIIFSVLFAITLINIFIDEQKNNKLYYVIGYNKFRIFLIFISKVISLLILPFILSFGIAIISLNLFKIIVF